VISNSLLSPIGGDFLPLGNYSAMSFCNIHGSIFSSITLTTDDRMSIEFSGIYQSSDCSFADSSHSMIISSERFNISYDNFDQMAKLVSGFPIPFGVPKHNLILNETGYGEFGNIYNVYYSSVMNSVGSHIHAVLKQYSDYD